MIIGTGLSFTVSNSLAGFTSCIMRGVYDYVHRVSSAVLGLQFACMRNPNLVCAFLTCTHTSANCCVHV